MQKAPASLIANISKQRTLRLLSGTGRWQAFGKALGMRSLAVQFNMEDTAIDVKSFCVGGTQPYASSCDRKAGIRVSQILKLKDDGTVLSFRSTLTKEINRRLWTTQPKR